MNKKELLIVLGSPNSPAGELSTVALSRLETCVDLYNEERRNVLCTGGWGKHFNTTHTAHAEYARRYLVGRKVNDEDILDAVLSSNTVEDAVKTKEILSKIGHQDLIVITSDYHVARTQIIFDEILAGHKLTYISTISNLSSEDLSQLKIHEARAIESIKRNGLYY